MSKQVNDNIFMNSSPNNIQPMNQQMMNAQTDYNTKQLLQMTTDFENLVSSINVNTTVFKKLRELGGPGQGRNYSYTINHDDFLKCFTKKFPNLDTIGIIIYTGDMDQFTFNVDYSSTSNNSDPCYDYMSELVSSFNYLLNERENLLRDASFAKAMIKTNNIKDVFIPVSITHDMSSQSSNQVAKITKLNVTGSNKMVFILLTGIRNAVNKLNSGEKFINDASSLSSISDSTSNSDNDQKIIKNYYGLPLTGVDKQCVINQLSSGNGDDVNLGDVFDAFGKCNQEKSNDSVEKYDNIGSGLSSFQTWICVIILVIIIYLISTRNK